MKIDVESNEWEALELILDDGILKRVKQFAVEIHTKEFHSLTSSVHDLFHYWTILRRIELLGFRKWYWHMNMWGKFQKADDRSKLLSCCYELVYVNLNYLE